jgi:LPXTG-motif cell wall-anchored protein
MKKITMQAGAAGAVALVLAGGAVALATPSDKVRICHATASATNPYTNNDVNTSSVDELNNQYLNGHGDHAGDIIPPFTSPLDNAFAGRNWDGEFIAIWENNCAVPTPPNEPSPTPTPTEPPNEPSPTPTPTEPPSEPSPTPTPTEPPAGPTPPPTTPPAAPTPPASTPPAAPVPPSAPTPPAPAPGEVVISEDGTVSQGLPKTGAQEAALAGIGGLLLAAGTGAMALARRKY